MKSYLCNPALFQEKITKNLLHVYTGDGKGKTTAALGVVMRSLGKGQRVGVVQFMKQLDGAGDWEFYNQYFGESENLQWQRFGRKDFLDPKYPLPEDFEEVQRGLKEAIRQASDVDLLVCDELNVAISYNLCTQDDIEAFLDKALLSAHVVMTGRAMPKWLKERADLVTVMNMLKHPYEQGLPVVEGLDY